MELEVDGAVAGGGAGTSGNGKSVGGGGGGKGVAGGGGVFLRGVEVGQDPGDVW